MTKIHPTAIVEEGAILGEGVEIGPYCCVGPHVRLGAGCRLISQCHVTGYTTMGDNNVVYPFATIGAEPQDHSFDPACESYLKIGDNNIFRENVTLHRGTQAGSETLIGNHCLFMAGSHAGHNSRIGDHAILVNCAMVGGYGQIGDHAILSGLVAIHQFCRVGRFAMVSGGSVFSVDVPPFMICEGRNGSARAVNLVGLRRAGFSSETIRVIRDMHKIFFRQGLSVTNAIAEVRAQLPQIPEVLEFIEFYESASRGTTPPGRPDHR